MENNNNDKAIFIQMNEFVQTPRIISNREEDIVRYGENNQLPYELIEYNRTVGLHRAILNKKQNLFIGDGVTIDINDETKEKSIEKTLDFLDNINQFENIDDLMEKISSDLFLFGGTYLQIIWEKGGKKIKYIYHMPYEQIRSGKKDKYGQVTSFYYNTSEDEDYKWTTYSYPSDEYIEEMPAFSTKLQKTKPQIMYIHDYEAGNNYYSLPDYIGALKDLNTQASISDFHNSNIHNNMQPGFTFLFKGPEPDQDTKDSYVKLIKKKYSDTHNAGKPMVFFIDDGLEVDINQPDVSNISDMYQNLSEDIKENIIVSHQIPRAVSGLAQPGSLGNNKEIIEGLEMVRDSYIQPIQTKFLNKFNKIMSINSLEDIKLATPTINLSKYDLSELKGIFTIDEIREYLGKEAIGTEDQIDDAEKNNDEDNE